MKCNQCNAEFEGKFCPECGARAEETTSTTPPPIQQPTKLQEQPAPPVQMNTVPVKKSKKPKKPIYKKWWFYVIAAIALIAIIGTISGGSKSVKINWDEMILGAQLPEPPESKGEIHENSADELWIDINNISDKQYNDYIEACKGKGFTVDAKSDSTSYDAYNAEGYKLSLNHYDNKGDMEIELEKPMEMSTITWPTSKAGSQLPTPKSTIGKFSYEYDDNFFVYVGNTSRGDYAEYVNACSEKGFNVDYSKGDNYYYADNSGGWHVDIRYVGNNVMSINIHAPSEDDNTSTTTPSTDSSTESSEPDTTDKEPEKENADNGAIDPDFKAAMDSYEKFMDEYVAFMKKYSANPTDMGLLADYADYMSKYADFVEDFEKWEDEEMNAAETAYYIDVQARVSKKLLEVAG